MDFLAKIPAWAKAVFFAVIGLIVVAVMWKQFWTGWQDDIVVLETKVDDLKSKIDQGKEAKKRVAELEQLIESKRKELDKLKSILPENANWGQLARTIEAFASEGRVVIKISTPGPEVVHEDQLYIEQAYSFAVEGTYHDVARFFERISGMERIVNVRDLALFKGPGRRLGVSFNAVTFMQVLDEEEEEGDL